MVTLKFFHKVANDRKRKNLITKLLIDGEDVSNFDRIVSEGSNFFERLFTS